MSIQSLPSSRFNPAIYRATLTRSIRSELRKIVTLRSTWITFGVLAVLATIGTYTVAASDAFTSGEKISSEVITEMSGIYKIIAITFGALSVTAEYSSGTIRSTVLAQPNRFKAFISKLFAVTLFTAATVFLILCIQLLVGVLATGKTWKFSDGHGLALVYFWILIVLIAAMSLGVGYLIRSTAGTIVTMFAFTDLLILLIIIPTTFFQEILPKFIPAILMKTTVAPDGITSASGFPHAHTFTPTVSLLVWLSYTAIIIAFAFLRFRKSDV